MSSSGVADGSRPLDESAIADTERPAKSARHEPGEHKRLRLSAVYRDPLQVASVSIGDEVYHHGDEDGQGALLCQWWDH